MKRETPMPQPHLEMHGQGIDKVAYFVTNDEQPAVTARPQHSGMPPTPGRRTWP